MYSLLHFHFESTLRAIACARPGLLQNVQEVYASKEYENATPARRLHLLEQKVSDLGIDKDLFTQNVFEQIVYNFLDEMQRSDVSHVDLRLGIATKQWAWMKDVTDAARIFESALLQYEGLSVSFLGAINFSKSHPALDAIFERVLHDTSVRGMIRGLDINMLPEDIDKLKHYADYLRKLQNEGLKINLHLGELFDNQFSRQILSYITPNRIGHGVLLLEDEEIVAFIKERDICLDMCPVSNTLLGVFDWRRGSPAKRAIELGIPVTINTDDPVLFGTSLKRELGLAGLNSEEIEIVKSNSRKYSYEDAQ